MSSTTETLRSGLPVIFVTAQSDKATVARAAIAEPAGYLVHGQQLIEVVRRATSCLRLQ